MTDLATALANAGKALLDAADAIAHGNGTVTPQDAPGAPMTTVTATSAPSFEELPFDEYDEPVAARPQGHAAVCPAHNIEYRKGRYGPYCPSTSDDPKWSNEKGYCTVTPKSAAAWLRQHA